MQARFATVTVEAAAIRVQFNPAIAPVAATTGHLMQPGDTIELNSYSQIVNFRAIRETSTDATIQVTYWGS